MYKLSDIKVIRGNRAILDVPNLSIPTDKFTVILGHNGSGKSTMMSLLSGQQTPEQGQIALNGQSVSEYKSKELAKAVAFLPQKLPNSAGLTVQELVKLGRFPWRGALGRWKEEDYQIIDNAMQRTKVDGFANTLADELSGGERQRAWISMLLAQQSPLLLLDEPTSALDIQHQYQLMELLFELNHDNQYGVVAILHDINLALRYADHIIALKQGQIAFAGDAQLLEDEQRLSDLYQTPIKLLDHPQSNSAQATKVAIVCP